jgi:predicted porin
MIQYTTPAFSGFSAAVQLGYAGTSSSTTVANGTGDSTAFRLTYAAGPIAAAYAQETTRLTALSITTIGATQNNDFANVGRTATDLSNALADRKRTAYGATYNFGVARAGVTRSEGKAGSAADAGRFETTSFGVSIPLGALTLNATADSGEFVDSGGSANKIGARQLSAYYALSKRTNLYAISGELKNKTSTAKDSQFAVGLRHQF